MLNLFGKKKETQSTDPADYGVDYKDALPDPNAAKLKELDRDNALYTIGPTNKGNVVLKLHSDSGYNTMTLTMNKFAVRQMIRQLEAALDDDEDEETNND